MLFRKILSVLSKTPPSKPYDQASTTIADAVALHKQGKLDQAEPIYLRLLATDTNNPDLLQYLGLLNSQHGNITAAFRYWQQALSLSPRHFAALNNYGKALIAQQHYAQALTQFELALSIQPENAIVWHDRGNALYGLCRYHEACESYQHALIIDSRFAEAYSNLGNVQKNLGLYADAVVSYRKALEIRPDFADAYSNLGNALNELGQCEEAVTCCRKALELKPDFPVALNNLGNALKELGQSEEAMAAYCRALNYAKDFADVHVNLGLLLKDLNQLQEAETSFRNALDVSPNQSDILGQLGLVQMESQQLEAAEASYQRALQIQPDDTVTLCNLGVLLVQSKRYAEAEACYRRALAISPDFALVYGNLGNLLRETYRMEEAIICYQRALDIQPTFAEVHGNIGVLLIEMGRMDDAEAHYRLALKIKPGFTEVAWNLSLLLLMQGRYAEAWPYHESRYIPDKRVRVSSVPALPYPQWQGESLTGKSILLWPEQGYGDYIQFARYVPLLKQRGAARVTLACPALLKTLLETADGVDSVLSDLATAPQYDYWVFPLSLPLHLGSTLDNLPATLPYLHVPTPAIERWQGRFSSKKFKVGLVWQGNPGHKNDAHRSLPSLSTLAPLWTVAGVSFFSLQKPQNEKDNELSNSSLPCTALGEEILEFADSAAIIAQLDLIIGVDSAVIHLAGAINKPCWVMLPYYSDWRWLRKRTDSPWYPNVMRLFRQTERGNWSDVIAQITAALQQRVQEQHT